MLETIEVSRIKRFAVNKSGRDFAVGDIHGHFTRLQATLDAAGFNPSVDRLFSVGDLVDRGPESDRVLRWLDKPWFHAVRGNHDDYVCRYDSCDAENWMFNGGSWFMGMPSLEQANYAVMFRELPIAIEVETPGGLIGIVHADCPFPSWNLLRQELESPASNKRLKLVQNSCMWSRTRIQDGDTTGVEGIRALIVGHEPLRQPAVLGNVHHIDTGGWLPDRGYFTLLNLATLEMIPAQRPNLSHDWD